MLFKRKASRPTATEVAERLVVLQQVMAIGLSTPPRDLILQVMPNWSEAERTDFVAQTVKMSEARWESLRRNKLWSKLSPKEVAFSKVTVVTMTEQQQLDAIWRAESIAMLMWALSIISELPPKDMQVDGDLVASHMVTDVPTLLRNARLRDEAEIDRAREIAESWHWRSRTRQLIERGDPFPTSPQWEAKGIHSYDGIVRMVVPVAVTNGTIPGVIDEDFPVRGKAYRDMTDDEWSEIRSITMERHYALNWLCGYAPGNRWDETPTDT